MNLPGNLQLSFELIKNNTVTSKSNTPALHFLDDDLIRDVRIRHDYEFTYLHQFMRLQRTSLSVWPQQIAHMTPR